MFKEDCKCKSCKCGEKAHNELIEQIEDVRKPFTVETLDDGEIRHFQTTAPDHLFKWHADGEDRVIQATAENDWQFQFDNELPQLLNPDKLIMIPEGIIHRLIKGTSPLSIKINYLPSSK